MDMQDNIDRSSEKAALFIAIILTAIWVLGIAAIFYMYPEAAREISYNQSLTALMAVGLFLPLILIWIAALLARSLSAMGAETRMLRKAVEQMRKTIEVKIEDDPSTHENWLQSQLAQIAAHTKQTDSRMSELTDNALKDNGITPKPRNAPALTKSSAEIADEAQANLPLPSELKASNAPITIQELIKAMNFPDNENDAEGFHVLQRAFNDHKTSKLLYFSQDVLTMLSEDGIYMDDLRVNPPEPSAWRSFAKGARGAEIAALGLVRDRTALTLAKTRLKNDAAFREAVHGFLKQFDAILTEFEETAEDTDIADMGKTRSAIAFMLLGRVSGAFKSR